MEQKEKLVKIGQYAFDVSNISLKRKKIAKRMWDILFNIKTDENGNAIIENGEQVERIPNRKMTQQQADRGLFKIGFYILEQDFNILTRRMTFKEALKEAFLRKRITVRYIESLTVDEMQEFVSWIYEEMVGAKKKVVDLLTPMIEQIEKVTEGMTEKEISQLVTFAMTSLTEQVGRFQKSKATQRK